MNIKIIFLSTIALVASIGLQAQTQMVSTKEITPQSKSAVQDERSTERSTMERSKELASRLGLEQDQTERMMKADLQYMQAMTELRSASATDRDAIMKKGEAITNEHEATLKTILTADQFAKLMELNKAKSTDGRTRIEQIKVAE